MIVAGLVALASAGDSTVAERLAAHAKLAPPEACEKIARLLEDDPPEAERQACLRKLRELLPRATAQRSDAEAPVLDGLRTSAAPQSEERFGRYVILLGPPEVLSAARDADALTSLDLAYVCLRDLFAFDPQAELGHRFVVYASPDVSGEPQSDPARASIAIPVNPPLRAQEVERLARELGRMFVERHPARQLFAAGFGSGWADVARVYVDDRLAFLGDPFRGRVEPSRLVFEDAARTEYTSTRLPIEEIPPPAASACLLRLATAGGDARAAPDWKPFRKLFRESVRAGEPPPYLWPALQANAFVKSFGAARARPVLAEFRFPPGAFAEREADAWTKRAAAGRAAPAAERWKQDGEIVLREWRVLGPLPRGTHAASPGDPLDAENFRGESEGAPPAIEGAEWKSGVRADERGVVDLSALPGAKEPALFYLLAPWPDGITKSSALYVASAGEATVWLRGVRIARHAGGGAVEPELAGRSFARGAPKGSWLLVELASDGAPAALHVRVSAQTPFEYANRVELRSSDVDRRLAVVRYIASRRIDPDLLVDPLATMVQDAAREVRVAAARGLAGLRNQPDAVAALVDRAGLEKDSFVASTLLGALEELTFERFQSSSAAARWWREDGGKRWRQSRFAECELAIAEHRATGGGLGHNPGSYGGLCLARCFGGEPSHRMEVVLDAPAAGPREVRLRYACPRGGARIALRVWRGDRIVWMREGIEVAGTTDWQTWSWLTIRVGDVQAGRHRLEILLANGCIDCDVLGWMPAAPDERRER